ncbi:transcriptional regulator with XRE-family HTH domain [Arcanobacterium wilhelmae]|uniref:Transcriptional regulator with XRE-family HTH domain n=1 Tax=Arcanobacterium wilhelmae TaxID=1803177 RepID=A0ABT9NDZ8_9ACTO|nr:helix-turn-helix transcriptional regulator [Arcanobacterium wilhelmae]MDP9801601.1 transcriptional regulator with XRE-family HTH domain [Arcanobacterium wilhelmae]WFN90924.1 helix-turn-helix transcriptional regulator [Arcanobacterium wilhelmae]
MKQPDFIVNKNLEEFGNHMRNWRKIRRMSQQDVADRAHITRQTVAKIEQGIGSVRFEDAIAILKILQQDRVVLDAVNPWNNEAARARWMLTEKERVG